jgi:SAM-dependent methyltransferase
MSKAKLPAGDMTKHFAAVAGIYRELRTTDPEPVRHIGRLYASTGGLRAADIGCGAGRYDSLLFRQLPGLHLTCVDASAAMIEAARRHLDEEGFGNFETVVSRVEDLALDEGALDCVFSFNAVHHFDLPTFLQKARAGLKQYGRLFIYTRLPEQNARTIWGRFFPVFLEKETRLYPLAELHGRIDASAGLFFEAAHCFRFARTASLARLVEQARGKHYSTFDFYGEREFEDALARFQDTIRERFADTDTVHWHDENILIQARRIED